MAFHKWILPALSALFFVSCGKANYSKTNSVETEYRVNVRSFENVDSVVSYAKTDEGTERQTMLGSEQSEQGYFNWSIEAPEGASVHVRTELWSSGQIVGSQKEVFESGRNPICPEPSPVAKIYLADSLLCYMDLPQCVLIGTAKTRTNANDAKLKSLEFDFDGDGTADTTVLAADFGVDSMSLLVMQPKGLVADEENWVYFTATDNSDRKMQDSVRISTKAHADTLEDSRDGQKYAVRKIGSQVWMAQNLNYKPSTGSWCYQDKEENCELYGRLYTWNTVMMDGKEEGANGICPDGWHVPSNDEWAELDYFADATDNTTHDYTGGNSLKSKGDWENYNTGNDLFGFTALASGIYLEEEFLYQGSAAFFWTSSQGIYPWAIYRGIANWSGVSHATHPKTYAYSLRCVQNPAE